MNTPTSPQPGCAAETSTPDGREPRTSGEGASTALAAMLRKRQQRLKDTNDDASSPAPNPPPPGSAG